MKNIKLSLIGLLIFSSLTAGCSNEYSYAYDTTTRTETAEKLVAGTELFGAIYADTSYTPTQGVVATEIRYLSMKGLAMKMFLFEVDLKQDGLTIHNSLPNNGTSFGMQSMSKQALAADRAGNVVRGAVNADFYNMSTGVPRGPFHKNGVALKTSFDSGERGVFAITNDNKGLIATQSEYPAISASGVIRDAVGASVMLVRDGRVVSQSDDTVEPRTCIGVSQDGTVIYILVVDGRNFHYSNGMLFEELGECMLALGAYTAINLDGGGSSTFLVRTQEGFNDPARFQLRNWPTDGGGKERSVANGLLIITNK